MDQQPGPEDVRPTDGRLRSVLDVVARARAGDEAARDELSRLSYPVLRRMAHGRLPLNVRGHEDTDDVVQITLLRAIRSLPGFEIRGERAWFAYLRQILGNLLRDEVRRSGRIPPHVEVDDTLPGPQLSPEESLADQESLAAYERVLAVLPETQRAALVLRVEHGLTYPEIGRELVLPSADAARMLVNRALLRIGQERSRA